MAAELFARQGYHATGIVALGEAVGLGKGALYYHIGSKEELLFEISSRHVVEMVAYGERLLTTDVSPVEKFRRLSRHLMRAISDNLPELTVFFSEHRSLTGQRAEELHHLRERFEQIWTAILEEGTEADLFRDLDRTIVVKAILGMHNYSYLWWRPNGRLSPEDASDLFSEILLRGLLTDDASADRRAL